MEWRFAGSPSVGGAVEPVRPGDDRQCEGSGPHGDDGSVGRKVSHGCNPQVPEPPDRFRQPTRAAIVDVVVRDGQHRSRRIGAQPYQELAEIVLRHIEREAIRRAWPAMEPSDWRFAVADY